MKVIFTWVKRSMLGLYKKKNNTNEQKFKLIGARVKSFSEKKKKKIGIKIDDAK